MTPIYLLSMLRQVFYGKNDSGIVVEDYLGDAKPREMFIAACLLLPIIGIGMYPKLATQTYDVKAVAVAAQARQVLLTVIAQKQRPLYSTALVAPQLTVPESQVLIASE